LVDTRRSGGSPNYEREKDDGQVDDVGEAHGVIGRSKDSQIQVYLCERKREARSDSRDHDR